MAPIASPEPAIASPEKKKKRKDKSEKKRAREEDETTDGHRKHKKSKSVVEDDGWNNFRIIPCLSRSRSDDSGTFGIFS